MKKDTFKNLGFEKMSLSQLAARIKKNEIDFEKQANQKIDAESKKALAFIQAQFELRFVDYLELLKNEGIEYSAKFHDNRYHHQGSFIEFKKGEKRLRMDFSNANSYRYECPSEGKYGTMVYGQWDFDRFILFIHDNLLV